MKTKYLIVGTDTEIGKTVVSGLLFRVLKESGKDPFYFKPFQTGCKDQFDNDSDAKFVHEINNEEEYDFMKSIGSIYKNPKAPYFAARNENSSIDIEKVLKKIPEDKTLVMEGSGGLMVPVTEDKLLIDIIKNLDLKIILVARAGLGTINHTILSIKILEQYNLKPYKVIFVDKDNCVSKEMVKENMEAIKMFTASKVEGCISKINDFNKIDFKTKNLLKKLM